MWICKAQVTGDISYNGYRLDEFVPKKTAVYISQYDLHIPEMTVRETLDFSSQCQGVGRRPSKSTGRSSQKFTTRKKFLVKSIMLNHYSCWPKEILKVVSARESVAGIIPDADTDLYMKVKILFSFYVVAISFAKKRNSCLFELKLKRNNLIWFNVYWIVLSRKILGYSKTKAT